jgi:hypothetical protein
MSKVQYFREQAARAERLARNTLDAVTVERLVEASRDYRSLADLLEFCPEPDLQIPPASDLPRECQRF